MDGPIKSQLSVSPSVFLRNGLLLPFNPLSVNDEYTRIAVTFEIRYWRVYSQKNIMKCGQLYHLAGNLHIVATLTKSLLKYF